MKLPTLLPGTFIKRYKRFLADIKLPNGNVVTAHCPNSGRMTTCIPENCHVLLSEHNSPHRKLKYTLEMTHNGKSWIVINTNRANEVAYEAICAGNISSISYPTVLREKKYGTNSRIDILAASDTEQCYIEVKSVTLLNKQGMYSFPDAPTTRGRKHLTELTNMVKLGHRAIMLFIIMRSDGKSFTPASDIDPDYASALAKSIQAGVECLAYQSHITPHEIFLTEGVDIILHQRNF